MTPDQVHFGQMDAVHAARRVAPGRAFAEQPARFVNKAPVPFAKPFATWINQAAPKVVTECRPQPWRAGIATNDDQRQPDAKDKIREAFDAAHHPVKIEVYEGCVHGWCASDGMLYDKAGAERAWGELTALYKKSLA